MQILPSKNPLTSSKASYIENTKLHQTISSKYFYDDNTTYLNINTKSNLNLLEATIFPYFIVVTKHVIYIDININQT